MIVIKRQSLKPIIKFLGFLLMRWAVRGRRASRVFRSCRDRAELSLSVLHETPVEEAANEENKKKKQQQKKNTKTKKEWRIARKIRCPDMRSVHKTGGAASYSRNRAASYIAARLYTYIRIYCIVTTRSPEKDLNYLRVCSKRLITCWIFLPVHTVSTVAVSHRRDVVFRSFVLTERRKNSPLSYLFGKQILFIYNNYNRFEWLAKCI